MQCNEIQEMLSAYIDGVLNEQETAEVEKHIRICSLCYQELTSLQETVKLLNSLGEVAAPKEFRSQLMLSIKAMPEVNVLGKGPFDGSKLSGKRQWVGSINKYMVAAVLMIGLGIGTGLYKLGAETGSHRFDLAYESKAQITKSQSEMNKKSEPADDYQIGRNKAPASGSTEIARNAATADHPDAPPGLGELAPANQGIMADSAPKVTQNDAQARIAAPDSPTSSDSSLRIRAQDPGKGTDVERSAAKSVEVPEENTSEGFMGTAAEVPSADMQSAEVPPQDSSLTENKLAAVEPEAKAKYSGRPEPAKESGGPEVSAEAASKDSSKASSLTAWWTLPGTLLAAGIACAGYYFYRRWRKN